SIEGIIPLKPTVNFILAKWVKTNNLDDLIKHLLHHHGIYIRDCRNFLGLENNYFRIAIRVDRENELLLNGIKDF
ncbi:MAG: threonine-phosphate decarboxylase, partial [Nitrospirae bacterium]